VKFKKIILSMFLLTVFFQPIECLKVKDLGSLISKFTLNNKKTIIGTACVCFGVYWMLLQPYFEYLKAKKICARYSVDFDEELRKNNLSIFNIGKIEFVAYSFNVYRKYTLDPDEVEFTTILVSIPKNQWKDRTSESYKE
jgi:hypothetical protein